MSKRYAIRLELDDGTILEPSSYLPTKALALRTARALVKGTWGNDVVAVWVDNTKTRLGLKRFPIPR